MLQNQLAGLISDGINDEINDCSQRCVNLIELHDVEVKIANFIIHCICLGRFVVVNKIKSRYTGNFIAVPSNCFCKMSYFFPDNV